MEESHTAALHRQAHEAFASGDTATLSEMISADAVFHSPGTSPISGAHRGKEAILAYFAQLAQLSGGTLKLSEHTFFLGDEVHSVAEFRATASRDGKTLDTRFCEVVRWSHGKCIESRLFTEDEVGLDEFWS